jgi:hypothetical protein
LRITPSGFCRAAARRPRVRSAGRGRPWSLSALESGSPASAVRFSTPTAWLSPAHRSRDPQPSRPATSTAADQGGPIPPQAGPRAKLSSAAARHDKPRERASPPADPTGRILSLPRLLTDQDVAVALDCSTQTVKRERQRGRLGFTRVAGRIRFNRRTGQRVPSGSTGIMQVEKATPARSATIGSVIGQTARCGAAPGSITEHDRHAAHRLAQTILSKPSSRSPRG